MKVENLKVEVVLDESLFGKRQLFKGDAFDYYNIRNGKFDKITTRNRPELVAVTKEQFSCWNAMHLIKVPVVVV